MKNLKSTRSSQYQYKFRERNFSNFIYTTKQGNVKVASLLEEAIERALKTNHPQRASVLHLLDNVIQRVALLNLTDKQYCIFHLYFNMKYNQVEVAELLNVGQPNITKTIFGNPWGGILKKLRTVLQQDLEFQVLMNKLNELQ